MDVVFYIALFATAVFILPWFVLYAVPMVLALGAAGWGIVEEFQDLMVPESHDRLNKHVSPLDKLDVFPYRKARTELRKVILVSRLRKSRNPRKATAS